MAKERVSDEVRSFVRQLHELEQRVRDGTLDPVTVRQPLQDIITGKFTPTIQLPSWCVSLGYQLANVRRWNEERDWGFGEADFPSEMPDFVSNSPLEVPVLSVYLPDKGEGPDKVPGYLRTADELWQIARSLQPNWWQWSALHLDAEHLRLLPGAEDAYAPGIRWTAVDLGANWNKRDEIRPRDVRGSNSANAEILAAAAHFPNWIQAMDGEKVPYAWLPGYQVTIPGDEARVSVPVLYWSTSYRRVNLDAYWDAFRYWYFAVPVRREL